MTKIILSALAIYLLLGFVFALFWVFYLGVKRDSVLAASKFSLRFLFLPGIIFTWPFFMRQQFKSEVHE